MKNKKGYYQSPRYLQIETTGRIAALYASRFIIIPYSFIENEIKDNTYSGVQKALKNILLSSNIVIEEERSHHIDIRFCPSYHYIQALAVCSRFVCLAHDESNISNSLSSLIKLCYRRWTIGLLQHPIVEVVGKWRTGEINTIKDSNYNILVKSLSEKVLNSIKKDSSVESALVSSKNIALRKCGRLGFESKIPFNSLEDKSDEVNKLFIDSLISKKIISFTPPFFPLRIYLWAIFRLLIKKEMSSIRFFKVLKKIGWNFWKTILKRGVFAKDDPFSTPGIWTWINTEEPVVYDPEAVDTWKDKRAADKGAESRVVDCSQSDFNWCRILALNFISHLFCEYYFLGKPDVLFRDFLKELARNSQIIKLLTIGDELVLENFGLMEKLLNKNKMHGKNDIIKNIILEIAKVIQKDKNSYLVARTYYMHAL